MDRNYSWEDQNPDEMQMWHEFQGQILEPEFIDSVAFQVDESSVIQSDEDELDDATRIESLLSKIKNRYGNSEERRLLKAYENHLSGDLNASVELGNHLVRSHEFTFAESLFRMAHDSGNPLGTHALGLLMYRKGQYPLAEGHLKEALKKKVPKTHYPLSLVLAKLGKNEESDAHLLSAYSEKDVSAICELGLRSLSFGDTESAEIFFIEGMNLGHSQSARELIKLRKKARKRKVEVKLYKEALEDGNELALSALRFLLFSKYHREILDLTDPNED